MNLQTLETRGPALASVNAAENSGGGDGWIALAACAVGASHTCKALPCQDDVRVWVSPDGLVVGAVADGIGSAPCADTGARLAVLAAVESLRAQCAGLLAGDEQTIRTRCCQAFARAAEAIGALARDEHRDADDYACTLNILLVAPDWIAAMLVGDGFVAWRPADSSTHRVLVPPEKGDFVNYTAAITGSDLESAVRFELRRQAAGFALASSDGLLYLALKSETWVPHQPFFEFMESFARSPDASSNCLQQLLGDPQINELTDDDKSLVLVGAIRHAPSSTATGAAATPDAPDAIPCGGFD